MKTAVLLLALALPKCGGAAPAPCTPQDREMIAKAAECRVRVTECGTDASCSDKVKTECDAWGEARCGGAK